MSKRPVSGEPAGITKNKLAKTSVNYSKSTFLNDTEAALSSLKAQCSLNLKDRFPPIYFVHQIYAIVKNKTKVDREVGNLQSEGKIILFKLRVDGDDVALAVAFTSDITEHILRHSESRIVKNFVENVLPYVKDVSIDKQSLKKKFFFPDSYINELVQNNILVIRDVGTFWLSFPRAGEFVKAYDCGRKYLLRAIAKSKYSEILQFELLKRKMPKKAVLGTEYYIYDLVGSDAVRCINTTSGTLLRVPSR